MAVLEVGTHIGGVADEVLNRMRPATNLVVEAARVSSSYIRLLRSDVSAAERPSRRIVNGFVIVPKELTRC